MSMTPFGKGLNSNSNINTLISDKILIILSTVITKDIITITLNQYVKLLI